MFQNFFKKKSYSTDCFKRLIHYLSGLSEEDLIKAEQLLRIVFDESPGEHVPIQVDLGPVKAIPKEETLDDTIAQAKNRLNVEQLEKNIEKFKQAKKPKS